MAKNGTNFIMNFTDLKPCFIHKYLSKNYNIVDSEPYFI